ncbi:MAG: 30S ribosomal protein S9 [Candidatus Pacearchaeota archaeon]
MNEKIFTSGKRKTAVARARILEGSGKIKINNKNYLSLQKFDRLKIEEPIRIAERVLGKKNFDVFINVRGGGEKSQIEAARLALARAILKYTNNDKLRDAYNDYDWSLLVADVRRKEPYKPGDSKARSKRQTSYR